MIPPLPKPTLRRPTGSLGFFLVAVLILIVCGVGALALDLAHVMTVRGELQNAADAAALAGAQELAMDTGNSDTNALQVAGQNTADGRAVSNASPFTNVTSVTNTVSIPETVQVSTQMRVNHMLAPIFGRLTDTLGAQSQADFYPSIYKIGPNLSFPIAVSVDQYPNGSASAGPPRLMDLSIGDPVTMQIVPSGVPGRNAVWTSFNIGSAHTSTYVSLVEQVLGQIPPDPNTPIPSLEAGKSQILLDNGLNQGVGLDDNFLKDIQNEQFLLLPVIAGNQYNQAVTVLGFVTVKVNTITHTSGSLTIQGTLVKGLVKQAWGGSLPPGTYKTQIENISAAVIKLVPIQ